MATSNPNRRRGPKKTGGNRAPDIAWIQAVRDELVPANLSTKPAGFLYDVQWQWTGYADEVNPDFFAEWGRRSGGVFCNGTSFIRDETGMYIVDPDWVRLKRQCLRPPIKGGEVCYSHGGSVPVIKAAAQQRLDEAAEIVALRLLGLTGARDEENYRIRPQDRIAAINSALDRAGIKGLNTVNVEVPGFKKVLDRLFTDDSAEED